MNIKKLAFWLALVIAGAYVISISLLPEWMIAGFHWNR